MRILRPGAKVSPFVVSVPEAPPSSVFGVTLETLRENEQMIRGIPLVLRDMVEYLDSNGKHSILLIPIGHPLFFT